MCIDRFGLSIKRRLSSSAPGLSIVITFALKRMFGSEESIADLVFQKPELLRDALASILSNEISVRIISRIIVNTLIEECSPQNADNVDGLVNLFLSNPKAFREALLEMIDP